MRDDRLLPDGVDGEIDAVTDTAGDHGYTPMGVFVQHERHGDQRLEGVALGATIRCDIGLAGADPVREVEDAGDRLRRDARPVVRDGDPVAIDLDVDHRGDARLLTGVQGVVGQLLDQHQGPLVRRVAGLRDQLFLRTGVEQPRRAQGRALQTGRHRCTSCSDSMMSPQTWFMPPSASAKAGSRCRQRPGSVRASGARIR